MLPRFLLFHRFQHCRTYLPCLRFPPSECALRGVCLRRRQFPPPMPKMEFDPRRIPASIRPQGQASSSVPVPQTDRVRLAAVPWMFASPAAPAVNATPPAMSALSRRGAGKPISSILGEDDLPYNVRRSHIFSRLPQGVLCHKLARFCIRCKSQISENRVARGSCFCSAECRRQDKIERRRESDWKVWNSPESSLHGRHRTHPHAGGSA